MSLQEKLDAIRVNFETKMAPPEVVEAFHRHRDQLIATGQAERAVGIGQAAPSFELQGRSGTVRLAELRQRGPVVVTWFRGNW